MPDPSAAGPAAPVPPAPVRLALYQPDIPGNVGTLIRLGACLGVGVDLIEPMGFPFGHRALARAGMDYLSAAAVARHADWAAFLTAMSARGTAAGGRRIVLLTTRADAVPLPLAAFRPGDTLLLGSEGAGVPDGVHARADLAVRVPMRAGLRSLNVAAAGAIALGEALRQLDGWPAD